ncbi:MAG: STAS domain-containing protein [Selenomonas sp.]|nr:STAS domain-containing protein [Selenomonas sp.]
MELKKEVFGVWVLFTLKGRLDMQTAPEFDKEVFPEIEKRLDIALDVSDLEYISSMGIRSLVQTAKKTGDVHHRVAICGMQPAVKEILESAGVTAFLDVYDDLSDLPFAGDIHTSR